MYRKLLSISLTLIVSSCVSPATNMSPDQISQLSSQQLCELRNTYGWEQKTEIEIGKRDLNCDPDYNECLAKGADPKTPAMAYCIKEIQEKRAMKNKIAKQEYEIKQQQEKYERERIYNESLNRLQNTSTPTPPQFCKGFPFCGN